jgi:hypothetical protein
MSDTRGASGGGRDADDRVDVAIDRAVREMLDVEQPAGFGARVQRRIEGPVSTGGWVGSTSRWKILLPVAAAAILILAIVAPWRAGAPAPGTIAQPPTAAVAPPTVARPAPAATTEPLRRTPPPSATVVDVRPATGERLVLAAALAAGDTNFSANDTSFSAIDALEGPAAIDVGGLAIPLPSGLRSIEPAPMHIPALELPALPETPRERREE